MLSPNWSMPSNPNSKWKALETKEYIVAAWLEGIYQRTLEWNWSSAENKQQKQKRKPSSTSSWRKSGMFQMPCLSKSFQIRWASFDYFICLASLGREMRWFFDSNTVCPADQGRHGDLTHVLLWVVMDAKSIEHDNHAYMRERCWALAMGMFPTLRLPTWSLLVCWWCN